jgi:hypothetical protein
VITLVTISGAYGAGGSRVGPELAQRLDVPFLDRAIPAAVAERLAVPFDDAEAHDDQLSDSWLERMLRGFIGQNLTPQAWTPGQGESGEQFRRATEEGLLATAASGRGVIPACARRWSSRGSTRRRRAIACAARIAPTRPTPATSTASTRMTRRSTT